MYPPLRSSQPKIYSKFIIFKRLDSKFAASESAASNELLAVINQDKLEAKKLKPQLSHLASSFLFPVSPAFE